MDRKKKTFDAVKWVRSVRDAHYEQTKDLTKKERLNFYRKKGEEAQEELQKLAQQKGEPSA